MGLAASQARNLVLTARKSDLEFRGQQINNRRLALTYRLENIASDYSEGMSNKRIYIHDQVSDTDSRLSRADITASGWTIVDNSGQDVTSLVGDEDVLEVGLRNGSYHIQKGDGEALDWRADDTGQIRDKLYQDDDEAVQAKYEYESALVQGADKRLEMELTNINTQHKAIETEMEAVKKVIEKNIQKSFKTFA